MAEKKAEERKRERDKGTYTIHVQKRYALAHFHRVLCAKL